MRGGIAKKDSCRKPYVEDTTDVLRSQFEFFGKDDITFLPERGNAFVKDASPSITTVYLRTCYEEVNKRGMVFSDGGNVWIENSDWNAVSFV